MKFGKSILVCVIGMLFLASCEKDIIEVAESNDPVFTVQGQLDGESFELVAGDNDAYMHTMTTMENGVRVFSGNIDDGNMSVELGVYDGFIDIPGHDVIGEISNMTPEFSNNEMGELMVLSKSIMSSMSNSQFVEKIDWFVDGEFVGQNDAIIKVPGLYNVSAVVKFMDGYIDTLTNDMVIGYSRNANCSINFEMIQQGMIYADINSNGANVSAVKWFLDGDLISDQAVLDLQIDQYVHTLSAEVSLDNGTKRTKSVLIDGAGTHHTLNDFSILENLGLTAARDFNIRVRIGMNGKYYDSETADNSNSTLSILGLEFFGKNANNKDVYKVTAVIDALVRDNVGGEKPVPVSFTTVFGVEIP